MGDIISAYKVQESSTKEIWYIPKVNTDLFRDGNGVPLLRREVHEYTTFGRYKAIGCDNTAEHSCPLCSAYADNMYKVSMSLEETRRKITAYGLPNDKIEAEMQLFKQHAYSEVPFKKQDYVYLVVAVLENHSKDEMKETEFTPCFTMKLVRMTVDTYNRDFRPSLLAEDGGVFFDISYDNAPTVIEKARSRAVVKSNLILSKMQKFEQIVTKEFKSLHILDLIKIKPELKATSFDYAKSAALSMGAELDSATQLGAYLLDLLENKRNRRTNHD